MEKKKTYFEVWQENYSGTSESAKFIVSALKETYKGDSYVPWAVMEHAFLMLSELDPDAKVEKVQNRTGGYVHSDEFEINVHTSSKEGDNTKESITKSSAVSHMVIVRCHFMGKVVEEVYPIQDKAYNATKVFEQNMVNKALQRATVKAISRATGLAFKLYESLDLQFEDDVKPIAMAPSVASTEASGKAKKETVTKTKGKIEHPEVPADDPLKVASDNAGVHGYALADFIVTNDGKEEMWVIIDKFNAVLQTKYGVKLERGQTLEQILTVLKEVADPDKMLSTLRKVVS